MNCYIDGKWEPGNYFWASLQGIANDEQRARILEGKRVILGGRTYQVETREEEKTQPENDA